jgi:hypothetical protein
MPIIEQVVRRPCGSDVPSCSPVLDSLMNSIGICSPRSDLVSSPCQRRAAYHFSWAERWEQRTPFFYDLVGDAFVCKTKMASRLYERGIDNKVFNDCLRHAAEAYPFPLEKSRSWRRDGDSELRCEEEHGMRLACKERPLTQRSRKPSRGREPTGCWSEFPG